MRMWSVGPLSATHCPVTLLCSLVLHNRLPGEDSNLLAIEMKKWGKRPAWKDPKSDAKSRSRKSDAECRQADRERLEALTKQPYFELYPKKGLATPENVRGYVLGVFVIWYEADEEFGFEFFVDTRREEPVVTWDYKGEVVTKPKSAAKQDHPPAKTGP